MQGKFAQNDKDFIAEADFLPRRVGRGIDGKIQWNLMVTEDLPGVRVDVWLDVACLFKTRSEAQKACKGGKVDVNGQPTKPNRLVRPGDELIISRPFGRKQRVVVKGLAERHVAKADARLLYDDLTPAPTPEEIEMRRMERIYRAQMTPPKAPDKRDRRALRRLKGKV